MLFFRQLNYSLLLCFMLTGTATAGGIYQTPALFLADTFNHVVPSPKVIWVKGKLGDQIKSILGHRYPSLRIRYWQVDERTAWILEEIGKDKPISTGIVINNNRLERLKVLIFKESRGWEVKYPFFTQQFKNAQLDNNLALGQNIDNISGATLSVRAVKKMARLALLLNQLVNTQQAEQ